MLVVVVVVIIIIVVVIGATTNKGSWPRSEVPSILGDSWLLPTNSFFPASLHPFPHHLSTRRAVFPLFLVHPVAHTSVS
jgi:hypothetical protein